MSLLLIGDDVHLREELARILASERLDVECLSRTATIVARATSGCYELVILDGTRPIIGALETLKEIRQCSSLPIILLTDRDNEIDRIIGLELGADDCVQKPINVRELSARIRGLLRRFYSYSDVAIERPMITVGDLTLDPAARTAQRSGSPFHLSSLQFDILTVLLEAAGQIVTRQTIVERAFKTATARCDRRIDMHISKLRRKLGPFAGRERIVTARGEGYMYTAPLDVG